MSKPTTLTIRLAPELRNRLLSEMEASGRTADAVVAAALSEHLHWQESMRALGAWSKAFKEAMREASERLSAEADRLHAEHTRTSGNVARSAPARRRTGGDG